MSVELDSLEFIDKRAKGFFQWVNDGRKCYYSWNSLSEGLVPTTEVIISSTRYCVYCGEEMYPIQENCSEDNYPMKGHCCICKEALDEIDLNHEMKELLNKQENEREELKKKYPEPNYEKLLDIFIKNLKRKWNDGKLMNKHEIKELLGLTQRNGD